MLKTFFKMAKFEANISINLNFRKNREKVRVKTKKNLNYEPKLHSSKYITRYLYLNFHYQNVKIFLKMGNCVASVTTKLNFKSFFLNSDRSTDFRKKYFMGMNYILK